MENGEGQQENSGMQGWDCIQGVFERLYPEQKEPLHFGTLISWRLGGNDPLDGISIYDGGDFYHFVTFGFSELYEKELENQEYSGYGFELTLRLKKTAGMDNSEIKGLCGVLQALGRYIFEENTIFQPYEYIYTGQESGMDVEEKSKITGFITVPDQDAGVIDTPNGQVEFIQLVGMTDKELKGIADKTYTVKEMAEKLGHTLTDYSRDDLV